MTRINLLSREVVAERKEKRWILLGIVVAGVVAFLLVSLYTSKVVQLKDLQNDIKRVNEEITKYEKLEAELTRVREEKARIVKRLNAIKQLIEKDRQFWSQLLNEMSICVPEGIWLKTIDAGEDQLQISAVALDNFAIARYMVNLMQNVFFGGAELKNLNKTNIGDYEVRDFSLTASIRERVESE